MKRFVHVPSNHAERERERLLVQERIRTSTQVLRNWAYYDQAKRLAEQFVLPLDEHFERHHGFTATAAITVFDHMVNEWEDRLNDHWKRLSGLVSATTPEGAVSAYYRAFPDFKSTEDQLIAEMRKRKATRQQVVSMLLSHSDVLLAQLATFRTTEIAASTELPSGVVNSVLEKLSSYFSALRDDNVEHFFMNNPVWTKPAICIGHQKYFCVMPQLFFSFLFETLLSLVDHDSRLKRAYEKRRSRFLEHRAKAVLERAFPGAKVVSNYTWTTPSGDRQFETDLILQLSSFLILIEAKSARVPPAARRGAHGSLRQAIDDLLVAPSRQSHRLQQTILAALRGDKSENLFKEEFPVDLSEISQVLRLSITLEDLAFMQTNVNGLKSAGYVPADLRAAPTIMLTDLEAVLDLLDSPVERLHYLIQRAKWEGRIDYVADEIDLLATYLRTRLNLDTRTLKDQLLVLVDESEPIDTYRQSQIAGVKYPRPRPMMTPWWRDVLKRLASLQGPKWLEAAVLLAGANIEQQKKFRKEIRSLSKRVKRRRSAIDTENCLVLLLDEQRQEAIAALAITGNQRTSRGQLMQNVSDFVYDENPQVLRCAVMVFDVDKPVYPYAALAWSDRPGITVSGGHDTA